MSELLSLPSSAADLNLSPQRKREKLFEAMLSQLEAEARRRPVLMVFEDAHWIDPTSRELLDLMIDRVRRLPVLLDDFVSVPNFSRLGLVAPTSRVWRSIGWLNATARHSCKSWPATAALTADIVAEIVERTDGVPLFVEELTKAVLESAGQGDRVAAVLATTFLAAQSVPATLHASLMARLDRHGPAAKEIAQIGAVIGREFGYELIGGSGAAVRCRASFGARSARRGRTVVLPRCRAAILLSLQARTCAGGRLRHLAASEETGTTRSRRGGAGATFR